MIGLIKKNNLDNKFLKPEPLFSFSTDLGKHIKKWLKQIYLTYFFIWIFWMISLFFYLHTAVLFKLYTFSQLKNSVFIPPDFNFLFKLNLFYLALEFTALLLSIIWIVFFIGFILTNIHCSLFLYRYTWLLMLLFYLLLLFVNWDCFINESALYSFRNKTVTTQQILTFLFEVTRYRYNKYFWFFLFNINLIVIIFFCLFGFIYLWMRVYIWHFYLYWFGGSSD